MGGHSCVRSTHPNCFLERKSSKMAKNGPFFDLFRDRKQGGWELRAHGVHPVVQSCRRGGPTGFVPLDHQPPPSLYIACMKGSAGEKNLSPRMSPEKVRTSL